MLDGRDGDRWEVEHLSTDHAGDRCTSQVATARFTVIRAMVDDLVGIDHRWEVPPRSTGLLARLLPRTATTGLRGGFGIPVGRRRLGRVLRIHPEPGPQPCVVGGQDQVGRRQLLQPLGELSQSGREPVVLCRQVGIGRLP
jgi:hypothetical protein